MRSMEKGPWKEVCVFIRIGIACRTLICFVESSVYICHERFTPTSWGCVSISPSTQSQRYTEPRQLDSALFFFSRLSFALHYQVQ
jgi:hypothetical protein